MQGDAPIKYITFKVQAEFFGLIIQILIIMQTNNQISVFKVKKSLLLKWYKVIFCHKYCALIGIFEKKR